MRPELVSEINVAEPALSEGCETVSGMGHLLVYARVSTTDQQPQLQVDALKAAGCYRVFTETASPTVVVCGVVAGSGRVGRWLGGVVARPTSPG
jgi:hypothetical protein